MGDATFRRVASGEYVSTDGRHEISHVVIEDQGNGYGRTDHWTLVENGEWAGDYATLREAKAAA